MASRKHQPILIPSPLMSSQPGSYPDSGSPSTPVLENWSSSPTTLSPIANQMYSVSTPRARRPSPPQILLGAIDENSGTILPDTSFPSNNKDNPVTKLHVYSAIVGLKKKPTLASTSEPPANQYDMLVGPNGEKFTDLRSNRKEAQLKKPGYKRFMCFA